MAQNTFTGWQQTQPTSTATVTTTVPQYGISPYWHNQQPYVYFPSTQYLLSTTMTTATTGYSYAFSPPIDYGLAEGDVVFFKGDPSVRQYYDNQYQFKVLPDEPYRIKRAWTRVQGIDVDFVLETIDGEQVQYLHPSGAYLKKSDFLTVVDRAKREGAENKEE